MITSGAGNEVTKIQDAIATKLNINPQKDISTSSVGSTWGSQITRKAIEGLIIFLVAVVLYLSVRFEDLCAEPELTIQRVLDFFDLSGDVENIARLEVTPPESLGRWRGQDPEILAAIQRVGGPALEKFGY